VLIVSPVIGMNGMIPCKTCVKHALVSDIEVILDEHPNQTGSYEDIVKWVKHLLHTKSLLETMTGLITGPIRQEPKIRISDEKCPNARR
jgi:hypothetical protein